MAAAIPDSDGDSDGVEVYECEDTVASSRGSKGMTGEKATDGLDGTDDRSTRSTGNLNCCRLDMH